MDACVLDNEKKPELSLMEIKVPHVCSLQEKDNNDLFVHCREPAARLTRRTIFVNINNRHYSAQNFLLSHSGFVDRFVEDRVFTPVRSLYEDVERARVL